MKLWIVFIVISANVCAMDSGMFVTNGDEEAEIVTESDGKAKTPKKDKDDLINTCIIF